MIRKIVLSLAMFVPAMLLLAASPVLADTITLSLSNPVQSATPGSILTFDATVSAPNTNAAAGLPSPTTYSQVRRASGFVVCRACSTAWRCKSSTRPDGGKG